MDWNEYADQIAEMRALQHAGGPRTPGYLDAREITDLIQFIAARDGPDLATKVAVETLQTEFETLWDRPRDGAKFSLIAMEVGTPTKALLNLICGYLGLHFHKLDEPTIRCQRWIDEGSEASLKRAKDELCAQIKQIYRGPFKILSASAPKPTWPIELAHDTRRLDEFVGELGAAPNEAERRELLQIVLVCMDESISRDKEFTEAEVRGLAERVGETLKPALLEFEDITNYWLHEDQLQVVHVIRLLLSEER